MGMIVRGVRGNVRTRQLHPEPGLTSSVAVVVICLVIVARIIVTIRLGVVSIAIVVIDPDRRLAEDLRRAVGRQPVLRPEG